MHIGDNLKRIRKQLGIDQVELEERSGVSRSQISRMESGKQSNPQIETVVAIATSLGVSIEKLVFGEESDNLNYMIRSLEELEESDKDFAKRLLNTLIIASQSKKLDGQ